MVNKVARITNILGYAHNRQLIQCLSTGPKILGEIRAYLKEKKLFVYKQNQGLLNRLYSLQGAGVVICVPQKGTYPLWQLKEGVFGYIFEAYMLKSEISHFMYGLDWSHALEEDIKKLDAKVDEVKYEGFSQDGSYRVQDRSIIRLLINRFGTLVLYLFLASKRRSMDSSSQKKKFYDEEKWLKNAFSFEDGVKDGMFSSQLETSLFMDRDGPCVCGHILDFHDLDSGNCDGCGCKNFDLDQAARTKKLELELETLYPNTFMRMKEVEHEQIDDLDQKLLQDYLEQRYMLARIRE